MTVLEFVREFWWAVLLTVFSMILVKTYWDQVKWWWMNTWYAFPLIGKSARLARDDSRDDQNKGWLISERSLCADYAKFIGVNSKKQFDNYNSYLQRSGDLGRKPLSLFMWILIAALVVVEAMGFSYVLAGYTIPGASEAMQSYGAMGIAFLISVILVAFTHYSGGELYKNSKVNEARQEWRDAGKPGQLTYKTAVSLANSYEDDDKPHFTQMAHRVGKKPSYMISMLTLVFVVVVAVFATYVRGVVLEKELTNEVTGAQTSYFNAPKDLADVASAAETKALQDTQELDRHGGWGTFIVLAFIFVFLQILGVILGYKYGFAGKQSSEAYRGLGHGRFHTYDEVLNYVEEIVGVAQARLGDLQQRLESHNSLNGNQAVNTQKTFRDFLLENATRKYDSEMQHDAIGQKQATPVVTESVMNNSVPMPSSQPEVQEEDEVAKLKAELAKHQEIAELKRQLASLKGESA
jgi:hypothetical protein